MSQSVSRCTECQELFVIGTLKRFDKWESGKRTTRWKCEGCREDVFQGRVKECLK